MTAASDCGERAVVRAQAIAAAVIAVLSAALCAVAAMRPQTVGPGEMFALVLLCEMLGALLCLSVTMRRAGEKR